MWGGGGLLVKDGLQVEGVSQVKGDSLVEGDLEPESYDQKVANPWVVVGQVAEVRRQP